MEWWIWVVAAVALVAVEMLTPGGFYFLFFGTGALVAGLLALLGVNSLTVQSIAFLGVSVASVLGFRKPLLAKFQSKRISHHVDSMVGETAILVATLYPGEFGQAELRGSNWKVRNIGGVALTAGQRCIVEQVDGLTLNVRAAQ